MQTQFLSQNADMMFSLEDKGRETDKTKEERGRTAEGRVCQNFRRQEQGVSKRETKIGKKRIPRELQIV